MLGTHKKVRSRNFVSSLEFPRAVVALAILIIGFMLFLGSIADANGQLQRPGVFGIVFLMLVVFVGGFLMGSARGRGGSN
ncbi:MAG: hypothetical protein JO307_27245 [Bryobacterales bacterium]|nr:hypothetical protein [Bryobacterales bacterium]MBV9398776.1 hypothetical protein [Bryobacterales bacterium]